MGKTAFFNETGLDKNEENPGAVGSAIDVAKMVIYALEAYPDVFENSGKVSYEFRSEAGKPNAMENTNTKLNGPFGVVFSKTGLTKLSGGNLTVVSEAVLDQRFVVVVLGSSLEGRFSDAAQMIESVRAYQSEKNELENKLAEINKNK